MRSGLLFTSAALHRVQLGNADLFLHLLVLFKDIPMVERLSQTMKAAHVCNKL